MEVVCTQKNIWNKNKHYSYAEGCYEVEKAFHRTLSIIFGNLFWAWTENKKRNFALMFQNNIQLSAEYQKSLMI